MNTPDDSLEQPHALPYVQNETLPTMNTPTETKTPTVEDSWHLLGPHERKLLAKKLEQELQRLERWKEENYDRNKNQWISSVMMVCADFPNVADYIKQLETELQQAREELKLLKPPQGHGESCYYCKTPCSSVSANPSRWPIAMCHSDDPGVVKWHHIGCVSERLQQLSQWQECAREIRSTLQIVEESRSPNNLSQAWGHPPGWLDGKIKQALSLYTQLTQTEQKEKS